METSIKLVQCDWCGKTDIDRENGAIACYGCPVRPTYLVFAGETYYARGGINDFMGFYKWPLSEVIENLSAKVKSYDIEWFQILDHDMKMLAYSDVQSHDSDDILFTGVEVKV